MSNPVSPSSDPVAAQLAAYNARDLERFVMCYAADVEFTNAAGKRLFKGHGGIRDMYSQVFDENPNLHCVVVNQIRIGEYVIDEEEITGMGDDPTLTQRAVAIYRVQGGLITHVRFIP